MSYLVLALKYRPQRFAEVTGQAPVSRTLSNALKTGRAAQAYLFTGPRGVGKTSMARILAKALNCAHGAADEPCNECSACREITAGRAMDVIEIDGASNRGIGDIRELREAVLYAPSSLERKVYIIDEVHMLTQDAFNALLKTLEEPPPHVVFILATTEPLKVPQTILSRCQRFDFARLNARDAAARMRYICSEEGIEAEEDGLILIGRRAEGSMRDALTLLDQVVATGIRPLSAENVRAVLGLPSREVFFNWTGAIARRDPRAALLSLARAVEDGANLQELAEEFLTHLRNLLLVATDPSLGELLETTEEERAAYLRQAAEMNAADLLRYCRLCLETAGQMRRSAFPRTHLELVLAEMCCLPTALDLKRFIEVARGRVGPLAEEALPPAAAGLAAAGPVLPKGMPKGPAAPAGSGPAREAGPPVASSAPQRAAEVPADGRAAAPASAGPEGAGWAREGAAAWAGDPWQALLGEVGVRKPALAAVLASSWVAGEAENCLQIHIPGLDGFQKDQLERKANKEVLLELIKKNFGRPLGMRLAAAAPGTSGPAASAASASPAPVAPAAPRSAASGPTASSEGIRAIADLFGGDVLGPA